MAFASRSTKSALPGVLATEAGRARYETALRTAGVSRFAYGIDDVDAMIAELGTNLRYAFLSFPHVAHDFIPSARCHCPTAKVIYDMLDFHAIPMARQTASSHTPNLLTKPQYIKPTQSAASSPP